MSSSSFTPALALVVLFTKCQNQSSVEIREALQVEVKSWNGQTKTQNTWPEIVFGTRVILWQTKYKIKIAGSEFALAWHKREAYAKKTAVAGYNEAQENAKNLSPPDRPTQFDLKDAQIWYVPRLQGVVGFRGENALVKSHSMGREAFGIVVKAVDKYAGHPFAIKEIQLEVDADERKTMLQKAHKDIAIMQRLEHTNIIELLGHAVDPNPRIFMPLRDGSLANLVKRVKDGEKDSSGADIVPNYDECCDRVLKQMLQALNYLDHNKIVHRDLKPENILYYLPHGNRPGEFCFQLADFGLANDLRQAGSQCGTICYMAPELMPAITHVWVIGQSSKLDIWSLYATMAAVKTKFRDFPPAGRKNGDSYEYYRRCWNKLLSLVGANATLSPMARPDPNLRASAAQMLVDLHTF
ncbi:kinase-like domain-containing protein [Xylariaceae sp. FL0255]|nr:kinase-like domain-containing protein [Xylariaceae sp. FL0255]